MSRIKKQPFSVTKYNSYKVCKENYKNKSNFIILFAKKNYESNKVYEESDLSKQDKMKLAFDDFRKANPRMMDYYSKSNYITKLAKSKTNQLNIFKRMELFLRFISDQEFLFFELRDLYDFEVSSSFRYFYLNYHYMAKMAEMDEIEIFKSMQNELIYTISFRTDYVKSAIELYIEFLSTEQSIDNSQVTYLSPVLKQLNCIDKIKLLKTGNKLSKSDKEILPALIHKFRQKLKEQSLWQNKITQKFIPNSMHYQHYTNYKLRYDKFNFVQNLVSCVKKLNEIITNTEKYITVKDDNLNQTELPYAEKLITLFEKYILTLKSSTKIKPSIKDKYSISSNNAHAGFIKAIFKACCKPEMEPNLPFIIYQIFVLHTREIINGTFKQSESGDNNNIILSTLHNVRLEECKDESAKNDSVDSKAYIDISLFERIMKIFPNSDKDLCRLCFYLCTSYHNLFRSNIYNDLSAQNGAFNDSINNNEPINIFSNIDTIVKEYINTCMVFNPKCLYSFVTFNPRITFSLDVYNKLLRSELDCAAFNQTRSYFKSLINQNPNWVNDFQNLIRIPRDPSKIIEFMNQCLSVNFGSRTSEFEEEILYLSQINNLYCSLKDSPDLAVLNLNAITTLQVTFESELWIAVNNRCTNELHSIYRELFSKETLAQLVNEMLNKKS